MKILRVGLLFAAAAACGLLTYHYGELLGLDGERSGVGAGADGVDEFADAPVDYPVHAIGRLAPASGVIHIGAAPGERIEELYVVEGDVVEKDQSLGKLASHDLLLKKEQLLEKQKEAAIARQASEVKLSAERVELAALMLRQASERREEDIAISRQQARLLRKRLAMSENQVAKLGVLREQDPDLVSAVELDKQRLLTEQTKLEAEQAELAERLAEKGGDRAIEAAQADFNAATVALEQLQDTTGIDALDAEIEVAREQRQMSELRSPIDGVVLRAMGHAGDLVTQLPIMHIGDLAMMRCIAEVYDSDVKRVREGQQVAITSPAFHSPFDKDGLVGVVRRVGSMVTSPGLMDSNPLAASSNHVVRVEIDVMDDEADGDHGEAFKRSATLVDLQVDVIFHQRENSDDS